MLPLIRSLAISVLAAGVAHAQDPAQDPLPTIAEVDGRIETTRGDAALDETLRTEIVELLTAVRASLQRLERDRDATERFADALASGAARAASIRAELDARPAEPEADVSDVAAETTAEQIAALVEAARAELAGAQEARRLAESALASLDSRATEIGAERDAAGEVAERARGQLRAGRPEGESAAKSSAATLGARAAQAAAEARLAMLSREQESAPARRALAEAERDRAARRMAELEARVAALTSLAESRREAAARAARERAEAALQAAADEDPRIRRLAEQNAALPDELDRVSAETSAVERQRAIRERQRAQLADILARTEKQLERTGVGGIDGRVALEQRTKLPDLVGVGRRQDRVWLDGIATGDARRFAISIELTRLSTDFDGMVSEALRNGDQDNPFLRAQATTLLEHRVELLRSLDAAWEANLSTLRGLEAARGGLEAVADRFGRLLDEELVWVPTAPPISRDSLGRLGEAAAWLFAPASWGEVVAAIGADSSANARTWWAAMIVLFGLVLLRRRARRGLEVAAAEASSVRTDSFLCTVHATLWTFVLAAPVPLTMAFLGDRLEGSAEHPFVLAIGNGLLRAAKTGGVLVLIASGAARRGLGEVHLGLHPEAVAAVRRWARWATPILIAAIFVHDAAAVQHDELVQTSLGRFAYIVAMIVLSLSAFAFLRPSGAFCRGVAQRSPSSLLARLPRLWFILGAGFPLVFLGLTALGFTFASQMLTQRFVSTVWLIISVTLVQGIAWRWFRIRSRQLAYEEALKSAESSGGPVAEVPEIRSDEVDVAALSDQGRSLLRSLVVITLAVGAWLIWSDALPAISMLNRVQLWSTEVITVEGSSLEWITLQDVASAILILIAAAIAARNLAGVLEIAVLKNLPLDAGSRYAITTLSRYVIVGVAIGAAAQVLGFGWSKAQWLVAALGVGLGFGLQEIVANFVSGLILLFERPIRVGDTVTVGNVQGVVSRIRMRATTITDWDRMELIVPNKDLITTMVQNWTLSSSVNRVVIKVGLEHGSDIVRAKQVMQDTVLAHPNVLQDPAPIITLSEIGPSALGFLVRCYLPDFDNRLATSHDLHARLYQELMDAGFRIAREHLTVETPTDPPPQS